jgi:hypothetical protein
MTAMDELTVISEEQRTHRRGVVNRLAGSVREARRGLSEVTVAAGAGPVQPPDISCFKLDHFRGSMAPVEYRRQSHLDKAEIVDLTRRLGLWSSSPLTEGS